MYCFALCIFSKISIFVLSEDIQLRGLIGFGLVRICTVRFRLKLGLESENGSLENIKLLQMERLL